MFVQLCRAGPQCAGDLPILEGQVTFDVVTVSQRRLTTNIADSIVGQVTGKSAESVYVAGVVLGKLAQLCLLRSLSLCRPIRRLGPSAPLVFVRAGHCRRPA